MGKLEEIFHLEETISSEKIAEYLDYVMGLNYSVDQKKMIFEAIFELADKQWHNYEKLQPDIQKKLEFWMIKNLDFSAVELVNLILGIVARLGLKDVYDKLKDYIDSDNIQNSEVRMTIINGIEEFGGTIDDPWSGMR